eukprot:Hpha_TRINITY_DN16336_c7_g3::TRINITY_DN16336_c7_g3_i1::g.60698::m.60698
MCPEFNRSYYNLADTRSATLYQKTRADYDPRARGWYKDFLKTPNNRTMNRYSSVYICASTGTACISAALGIYATVPQIGAVVTPNPSVAGRKLRQERAKVVEHLTSLEEMYALGVEYSDGSTAIISGAAVHIACSGCAPDDLMCEDQCAIDRKVAGVDLAPSHTRLDSRLVAVALADFSLSHVQQTLSSVSVGEDGGVFVIEEGEKALLVASTLPCGQNRPGGCAVPPEESVRRGTYGGINRVSAYDLDAGVLVSKIAEQLTSRGESFSQNGRAHVGAIGKNYIVIWTVVEPEDIGNVRWVVFTVVSHSTMAGPATEMVARNLLGTSLTVAGMVVVVFLFGFYLISRPLNNISGGVMGGLVSLNLENIEQGCCAPEEVTLITEAVTALGQRLAEIIPFVPDVLLTKRNVVAARVRNPEESGNSDFDDLLSNPLSGRQPSADDSPQASGSPQSAGSPRFHTVVGLWKRPVAAVVCVRIKEQSLRAFVNTASGGCGELSHLMDLGIKIAIEMRGVMEQSTGQHLMLSFNAFPSICTLPTVQAARAARAFHYATTTEMEGSPTVMIPGQGYDMPEFSLIPDDCAPQAPEINAAAAYGAVVAGNIGANRSRWRVHFGEPVTVAIRLAALGHEMNSGALIQVNEEVQRALVHRMADIIPPIHVGSDRIEVLELVTEEEHNLGVSTGSGPNAREIFQSVPYATAWRELREGQLGKAAELLAEHMSNHPTDSVAALLLRNVRLRAPSWPKGECYTGGGQVTFSPAGALGPLASPSPTLGLSWPSGGRPRRMSIEQMSRGRHRESLTSNHSHATVPDGDKSTLPDRHSPGFDRTPEGQLEVRSVSFLVAMRTPSAPPITGGDKSVKSILRTFSNAIVQADGIVDILQHDMMVAHWERPVSTTKSGLSDRCESGASTMDSGSPLIVKQHISEAATAGAACAARLVKKMDMNGMLGQVAFGYATGEALTGNYDLNEIGQNISVVVGDVRDWAQAHARAACDLQMSLVAGGEMVGHDLPGSLVWRSLISKSQVQRPGGLMNKSSGICEMAFSPAPDDYEKALLEVKKRNWMEARSTLHSILDDQMAGGLGWDKSATRKWASTLYQMVSKAVSSGTDESLYVQLSDAGAQLMSPDSQEQAKKGRSLRRIQSAPQEKKKKKNSSLRVVRVTDETKQPGSGSGSGSGTPQSPLKGSQGPRERHASKARSSNASGANMDDCASDAGSMADSCAGSVASVASSHLSIAVTNPATPLREAGSSVRGSTLALSRPPSPKSTVSESTVSVEGSPWFLKKIGEYHELQGLKTLLGFPAPPRSVTEGKDMAVDANGQLVKHRFVKLVNLLRLVVVMMNSLIVPFCSVFATGVSLKVEGGQLFVFLLLYLGDIVLIIDLYQNFFEPVITKEGRVVTDPKDTAMRYLKSDFAIDFIAAFPFELLILASKPDLFMQTWAWRQNRLIGLLRSPALVHQVREDLYPNAHPLKVQIAVFLGILFTGLCWLGCVWAMVLHSVDGWEEVDRYLHNPSGTFSALTLPMKALTAFHWALRSFSGYEPNWPITHADRYMGLCLVTAVCGLALFATVIAYIQGALDVLGGNLKEHTEHTEEVQTCLEYSGIPDHACRMVNVYLRKLYQQTAQVFPGQFDFLSEELPSALSAPLRIHANITIAKGASACPLLVSARADFVAQVLEGLQHEFWTPGNEVIVRGDVPCGGIHFVRRGRLLVTVQGRNEYPGDM